MIVSHTEGPYQFYLLIQYMNKADHKDEATWDRAGTRELMHEFGIHVSGSDVTDQNAKLAAIDDIWAIFDERIDSDQINTSEEISANRVKMDARIVRLTESKVLNPGHFTKCYWA